MQSLHCCLQSLSLQRDQRISADERKTESRKNTKMLSCKLCQGKLIYSSVSEYSRIGNVDEIVYQMEREKALLLLFFIPLISTREEIKNLSRILLDSPLKVLPLLFPWPKKSRSKLALNLIPDIDNPSMKGSNKQRYKHING